jgi:streptogramin lyase
MVKKPLLLLLHCGLTLLILLSGCSPQASTDAPPTEPVAEATTEIAETIEVVDEGLSNACIEAGGFWRPPEMLGESGTVVLGGRLVVYEGETPRFLGTEQGGVGLVENWGYHFGDSDESRPVRAFISWDIGGLQGSWIEQAQIVANLKEDKGNPADAAPLSIAVVSWGERPITLDDFDLEGEVIYTTTQRDFTITGDVLIPYVQEAVDRGDSRFQVMLYFDFPLDESTQQADAFRGRWRASHGDITLLLNCAEPFEPEAPPLLVMTDPLDQRPAHFRAPEGLECEYVYRGFIQLGGQAAWGPDGNLYIADRKGRHVVRVSPEGEVSDLGLWRTLKALQDQGSISVAFDASGHLHFASHSHIFRYNLETEELLEFPGIHVDNVGSIAIGPGDQLYYHDRFTESLRRAKLDGDPETILTLDGNMDMIIAFGPDGRLYFTEHTGGLNRKLLSIDVETREVDEIIPDFWCGEVCHITFDPDGDVWVMDIMAFQYALDGTAKPIFVDGTVYETGYRPPGIEAGMVFDEYGRLWITRAGGGVYRLDPVTPDTTDPEYTFVEVMPALAFHDLTIAPGGDLYAFEANTGGVWRISEDGETEILGPYRSAGRKALAVDEDGVIYLAMPSGGIYALGEDGPTRKANLTAQRLVLAGDGNLYATAGEWNGPKSIVRIGGENDYTTIATEIEGIPLDPTEIDMTVAGDHGLYVLDVQRENLYYLDFEGNGRLVDNLGEHMAWAMAASPVDETLYFISHFEEPGYNLASRTIDGTYTTLVYDFAEASGFEVTEDGEWLYVGAQGFIIRFRIGGE